MKKEEEKELEVAMTYRLCPVCTKKIAAEIVMNSLLTKAEAAKVKELHGQVVGMNDKMCDECKEAIGDGVYFIGIDLARSTDHRNPYRSGNIVGIKREAAERMLEGHPDKNTVLEKQACFIDVEEMKAMGMIE